MLSTRLILVTGASSGIGRGLALEYARHGARVWAVARSADALAQLPVDAEGRVTPVPADVTTAAGRRAIATSVEHEGGCLDVVVHAAGMLGSVGVPLVDYPEDEWRSVFEVNVTAVHLLHQRLAPFLERGTAPAVIGLASTVGREPRAGWGMYAVSKHALEGWLGTLAQEWETGRVYSVNPGGTRTPMRAQARPDEDPGTVPTPEQIAPLFLRLAHSDAPEPSGARLEAGAWIGRDPWEGLGPRRARGL
ncbi:MAG: SDR family NAD(P)-dependent oxidoreductase [Actinomycetota bacterium]|nr:SDR family NAD(P)-dependent oxidoreductase [Actinomycetota bacterium]